MNVQAEAMTPELKMQNRAHRSPVCFEIPSYYEITVYGKKLAGSSQMRVRGGILQHGTIYLDGDIGVISHYLTTHADPQRIRSRTSTLREALGSDITYGEVAQALVEGFSGALNLDFTAGILLPNEEKMAEHLVKDKYGSSAWTHRL
jgi:lipoate-protein ligase A